MDWLEGKPDRRAQHFNIFKDVLGMGDPFEGSAISDALSFGGPSGGGGDAAAQQQAAMAAQANAQQQQMMYVFAGLGIVLVLAMSMKSDGRKRR